MTFLCKHFDGPEDCPTLNGIKEECVCCGYKGPDLWLCLHQNCFQCFCSENIHDHRSKHNKATNGEHVAYLSHSADNVWCYECQSYLPINDNRHSSSAKYSSMEVDSDEQDEDEKFIDRSNRYTCKSPTNSVSGRRMATTTTNATVPEYSDDSEDETRVGVGSPRISKSTVGEEYEGDDSDENEVEDEDEEDVYRPTVGLVGLQNIGNTCYMNAALQALSNTIPLTNFFLKCPTAVQTISEGRKPGLCRQYQMLMNDMWNKKSGGYVTPSGILYGIRNVHAMFRGFHQHDTQEFLRNFMDQLHEELKQVLPPECAINDIDNISATATGSSPTPETEPTLSSSYESSEGEYETCDSGVSERSSLSDDTERSSTQTSAKRRLSRGSSPRRRARIHSGSVIDSQPSTSTAQHQKKPPKYRSIISDIFDGKLLSSVQCLTCDRVSSRVETFQDLSLPIPSRDHLMVLHGRNSNGTNVGMSNASSMGAAGQGANMVTCSDAVLPSQEGWISWIIAWLRSWFYGPTVTLHDCLAAFFSTDELKGDNMYSCERCNKLRNGLKYSKVLQLPEVLSIHLKRFRHELMYSSKISSAVSFPLKGLEMKPYLHKDCISEVTNYELFSVICHHGTAGGGHYTCYAMNNNQWYEFDDQCVTKVSAEVVQNCEAYVLFYRKVIQEVDVNSLKHKVAQCILNNKSRDMVYISKQWMSRFNTCAEPGPIDNSDFLCIHGNVNPRRITELHALAALIPKDAYDHMYKKYGGCQPLLNPHPCNTCQQLNRRIVLEVETLDQLNTAFKSTRATATHYLSSTWFNQWKNFIDRRTTDPPGPIDNTRTSSSDGGTEDYIEINEDIWKFFYNIYGGGPELLAAQPEEPINNTVEDEDDRRDMNYGRGEPMQADDEENTSTVSAPLSMESVNDADHSTNYQTKDNSQQLPQSNLSNVIVNGSFGNIPEGGKFKQHRRRRRRE